MRNKPILIAAALALSAGCATWTFEPTVTTRFVNDYNEYATVDYGKDSKPHMTYFETPKGTVMPFRSPLKVRVEMPDGTRFVAYQNMSEVGILYRTDNGRWEFLSQGISCIVAERAKDGSGYLTRFTGILCAQELPDRKEHKGLSHSESIPVISSPHERADTLNVQKVEANRK